MSPLLETRGAWAGILTEPGERVSGEKKHPKTKKTLKKKNHSKPKKKIKGFGQKQCGSRVVWGDNRCSPALKPAKPAW